MKETVITISKQIKLIAYIAMAFALLSGVFGYVENGIISLALWFGFIFFGFLAVMVFSNMSEHNFVLKIDDQGITDHTPMLDVGLIRWEEIQDIGVDAIHGQHCLLLKVENTQFYLNRLTTLQRVIPYLRKMGTRHYENGYLPINFGSMEADAKSTFELIVSEFKKYENDPAHPKKTITEDEYSDSNTYSPSPAQGTSEQTLNDPVNPPHEPVNSSTAGGLNISDLDTLEKLAELRDKGILTQEEFEAKKQQLLGL